MVQSLYNFIAEHLEQGQIKLENHKVLVFDAWYKPSTEEHGGEWLDATHWTISEAKNFLGY